MKLFVIFKAQQSIYQLQTKFRKHAHENLILSRVLVLNVYEIKHA